ncbi:MAG: response regulator transcription factor, partial [Bacteroidetes bacterium]|nr:response regulator transcription factor [Bacteroidota bacterium]
LQIQIILMDIEMKTEDGIASCGHIKALYPDVKILMVSAHHSESYILKAFKNKADGYFFKDQDAEELREALKHLMGNQKYYQHEVKKLLLENQLRKNDNELHNKYNLSAKEVAVLEMILKGYSVKQMSDALYRSENTIATHRKNIMHKIGAHREADIVQFAIKSGLMKSE